MFTAQDILDIAIRLESNGEKTYRDARRYTEDEDLKSLLDWIAREEQHHGRWFAELRDRLSKGEDDHLLAEMSKALAEDVVREQAFSLQEVDFEAITNPDEMIRTFIGFEEDTIAFYNILKTFIDDPAITAHLDQIVAEEKKHIAQFKALLSSP
jgi:rubrerythrin